MKWSYGNKRAGLESVDLDGWSRVPAGTGEFACILAVSVCSASKSRTAALSKSRRAAVWTPSSGSTTVTASSRSASDDEFRPLSLRSHSSVYHPTTISIRPTVMMGGIETLKMSFIHKIAISSASDTYFPFHISIKSTVNKLNIKLSSGLWEKDKR